MKSKKKKPVKLHQLLIKYKYSVDHYEYVEDYNGEVTFVVPENISRTDLEDEIAVHVAEQLPFVLLTNIPNDRVRTDWLEVTEISEVLKPTMSVSLQ